MTDPLVEIQERLFAAATERDALAGKLVVAEARIERAEASCAAMRGLLARVLQPGMSGHCEPEGECQCDDEDGGLGRARRSEWCGGPCVLREEIGRILST